MLIILFGQNKTRGQCTKKAFSHLFQDFRRKKKNQKEIWIWYHISLPSIQKVFNDQRSTEMTVAALTQESHRYNHNRSRTVELQTKLFITSPFEIIPAFLCVQTYDKTKINLKTE